VTVITALPSQALSIAYNRYEQVKALNINTAHTINNAKIGKRN